MAVNLAKTLVIGGIIIELVLFVLYLMWNENRKNRYLETMQL